MIGQVEDAASAAMLGRDTNRYCLFLMLTNGCADLRTLKNIMALYFKWVLTVVFGIYSRTVSVSQCVCVCVYEPVTKNESLLVYACAIVCMCYGIYVQYCFPLLTHFSYCFYYLCNIKKSGTHCS